MSIFLLNGECRMFTDYEKNYDLDGLIYVEDIPCQFHLEVHRYQEEDGRWGYEVDAKLRAIKLGRLWINREDTALIFGVECIKRVERLVAEYYSESQN